MTGPPIYIHTRDRLNLLERSLPHWLAQRCPSITLVVETSEYYSTRRWLNEHGWGNAVDLLRLRQVNAGMGNARHMAVKHANAAGHKVIIMSDDDQYPKPGSDVRDLARFVWRRKAMGIGACMSIYGLSLGNDVIKETSEPIPVTGSWGYQMFALNIDIAMEVGNFDRRLTCGWEDHELNRAGIAAGFQWHIHTGVPAVTMAKRYGPGGISTLYPDLDVRKAQEKECHRMIHERWPAFVSTPDKPYRCSWTKMLRHYGLLPAR